MRYFKGSSIIEYIIPLALIGVVVGLGLFYMFSSGNFDSFFRSSMKADGNGEAVVLDKNQPAEALVSELNRTNVEKINAGGLGGSQEDPKIKCKGGKCAIDFGDYVLSGIPADFSQFVESSATSGGTEKLVRLIEKIANQPDLDAPTRNLLLELANEGHTLARTEEEFEGYAQGCTNNGCPDVDKLESGNRSFETGEALKSIQSLLAQVKTELGSSSNIKDSNALAIASLLTNEIITLARNTRDDVSIIVAASRGRDLVNEDSGLADIAEKFLSPGYSNLTDLDSVIICKTGDGSDPGYNCN